MSIGCQVTSMSLCPPRLRSLSAPPAAEAISSADVRMTANCSVLSQLRSASAKDSWGDEEQV